MRPLQLTLTGFLGIRSGLNRESVTLDFRQYRGLIAFIGDNGKGKSTILSNMHPYRLMPDRVKKFSPKAFSFYHETYGKSARKEFIFEIDGEEYQSLVLIDADRKKQEAYLYRRDSTGIWQPYAHTDDGKLDVYDEAVEALCGTPRMFFTSVMRSQKAPALSSYTRAEMMDIFSELIDLEDNKDKKNTAGDVIDALLGKRSTLVSEKDRLEIVVKDENLKVADKVKADERLAAIARELSDLDEQLKTAEVSLKQLEIKESIQGDVLKRQQKLAEDISGKEKQVVELQFSIKERSEAGTKKYNDKLQARQTAEKKLPDIAAEVASTEERLKINETSLKELEIKESLQADAEKRRTKLSEDISGKEKQKAETLKSIAEKKTYFNQRFKDKTRQQEATAALANKAADLQQKAADEVLKTASATTLRNQIQEIEAQLSSYSAQLREIGTNETLMKETEAALQKLHLSGKHAFATAQIALKTAQESAKKLDEANCVFPDKASACKFVKAAAIDKEALPALEEALKKAQEPDPQEKVLEAEISRLTVAISTKPSIVKQEQEAAALKEAQGKELAAIEKTLESLRHDLKDLSKVEEAKASLVLLDKEIADILIEGKTAIADLEKQVAQVGTEIEAFQTDLKGIEVDETLPVEIKRLRESVEGNKLFLENLRKEEAALKVEIASLADIDSILKENAVAVTDLEKQVAQLGTEIAALQAELKGIEVDETLPAEIKRFKESVEAVKAAVELLRKEDANLRVTVGSLTEGIKQIEVSHQRISVLAIEIGNLEKDILDWQVHEKAMEGIITLEIDDAGPTVSGITNDILLSCYGPRFSVSIKTQDAKASGDAMKEVFDIVVFDGERDEKKSLSVTSGGEETWLDDSITRGISLFNASRGGKRYHALFSDEKDGRLTEKKRKEYMAVKRKVLGLGGFDVEYFISHSRDIQEMADAVIDLNEFVADSAEKKHFVEERQGVLV